MKIIFKSTPENFEKEESGRKRNTVRKIDMKDERFIRLSAIHDSKNMGYDVSYGEITIQNTETKENFTV
ncbi:MAG: hypothetical protein ACRCTZ_01730, partial [Sarcina sp.]